MPTEFSRRSLIAGTAAILVSSPLIAETPAKRWRYCLNTSTIRDNGKSRPIVELIDIAAKAGYDAIEPWIAELEAYTQAGGSLNDLRKRIEDAGLIVPDAIGFAPWIVNDNLTRRKGLETAKRAMEMVQQIGGTHLAAPPVGATRPQDEAIDLLAAADRYGELLTQGKKLGVIPIVEVWGFSKTLQRLGETLLVASECGQVGGCILPDVYHLYKGGSGFDGLQLVRGSGIGIFHINDYPRIERSKINDSDRVYPGDGIAPLRELFKTLKQINYEGVISLELFNRDYWRQDPQQVAKMGLRKMKKLSIL